MRRSSWVRAALALLALAAAGERASGATSSGEVVVEVYSGFPSNAPALEPAPGHFVVDVTGMAAGGESASEDEQRQFAQKLIVPYLARHPGVGLESAAVHVFRRGPKQECPDASAGASSAAGEALAQLDSELASAGGRNARVVLFSAFEGECAQRLCDAAARLVERGVWLELAAIQSDAAVPACLAALRPSAQTPIPWLGGFASRSAPAFSVEDVTADGSGAVLAQGTAGTPLRVEAGLRRIRVALDPPAVIGPIQVRADQRVRVRILDFPLSAPGERSWQVEVGDAAR